MATIASSTILIARRPMTRIEDTSGLRRAYSAVRSWSGRRLAAGVATADRLEDLCPTGDELAYFTHPAIRRRVPRHLAKFDERD